MILGPSRFLRYLILEIILVAIFLVGASYLSTFYPPSSYTIISKYLDPELNLISTTSLSGLSGFYVETEENTELINPVSVF